MTKKIEENTMKELLNVINNKKIQNMMCNKDVLNSLGEKPDMNKLMDCQDLHNVIADRDLMSKIFDLSKSMGSTSSDNNKTNNQKNIENKISSTDKTSKDPVSNNIEKQKSISELVINQDEKYYNELLKLQKMGYEDIDKNKNLLEKHDGDIITVLKDLL